MKPCFKSCLYLPSKVLLAWVPSFVPSPMPCASNLYHSYHYRFKVPLSCLYCLQTINSLRKEPMFCLPVYFQSLAKSLNGAGGQV